MSDEPARRETICAEMPERPIWYVHGALNGRVHAMAVQARQLAAEHPAIRLRMVYEAPEAADRLGVDHDGIGRIAPD
ncbi:hypothetical protein [Methylobacterium sp. SyP6R]|uniref:hypothetical protein n=1 Tax=Methylobacterium sp. SyP6R TaxID=2718876 RepID=UPI001F3420E9|nr:hypothetical protein [Methylobacterium sp. SyP6R]MCF4128217.1 hypothetical protein [Methylobacterium sp. SyP6R]